MANVLASRPFTSTPGTYWKRTCPGRRLPPCTLSWHVLGRRNTATITTMAATAAALGGDVALVLGE